MAALDWKISVADIAEAGLDVGRTATDTERAALLGDLEIVRVDRVVLTGRVKAIGRGGYHLEGAVKADVAQACVVTLDPVPEKLDITLSVDFLPEAAVPPPIPEGDHDEAAASDHMIEPIQNGRLDIGEVVYQEIAAALDPYPRAAGAALETSEAGPKDDGDTHPFAKLRQLARGKPDEPKT